MTGKRHFRSIFSFLSFFVFFTLIIIDGANAHVVASDSTIIDRLDKRLGVSIPAEFRAKLNNFVTTNEVMTNYIGVKFTEDFIVNEMQNDRGINKENQLLFIRSAIYKQITNEDLYNGSDGNDERLGDFMKVINNVKKCGKDYVNGFNTYMQQRSADAQQRSADAQQRSADAQQRSADATNIGLKQITEYYDLCKNNPAAINNEELEETKKYAKHVIQNCKKYGINYRAIILKEVGGDAKKVDEILKFYGVE